MINSDCIMQCGILSQELATSSTDGRLQESAKFTYCCPPFQLHTPYVLDNEQMEQTQLAIMHQKCCKALQDKMKGDICSSSMFMPKTSTANAPHHKTDIPSPVSVRDTTKLMKLAVNPPLSTGSSDPNPRKRKKVQFQSTPPQAYEAAVSSRSATTREEKAAFWYARSELDEFRHHSKRQCKQAWDECNSDLEQIIYPSNFTASSEAPSSAWEHDPELYKVAQNLGKSHHFELCRGLEHLTSQKLCLARSMTVLNAKTLFTLEQAQFNLMNDDIFDERESADRLASVYAAASHPASQFARMMALADAVAAQDLP